MHGKKEFIAERIVCGAESGTWLSSNALDDGHVSMLIGRLDRPQGAMMNLQRIHLPVFLSRQTQPPKTGRSTEALPASDGGAQEPTAATSGPRILNRLSVNERRRRLWHMLPGFLPLTWWVLPHSTPLSFTWQASLCALTIVMSIMTYLFGKSFARPDESRPWGSFVSYASMALAPVLLFPSQPEFSATVLAVLAFGDGSAALSGLLLRGPKLPWNPDKTWAGSIGFLLGSVPMATLFFWNETTPPVTWDVALLFAGSAALAGDIVESIPSQINDNIRVGLAANVTLVILQTFVIGW